jgi:hypothetical protein
MNPETNYQKSRNDEELMVWFFAGGETRDNKFNVFTGSFIRLMSQILEEKFTYIKGIYYPSAMVNVAWALSHAQRPCKDRSGTRMQETAFRQIISNGHSKETRHIIVSSSSGSVVAAQTACYIAEKNRGNKYFNKPFHLALGASMISKESELFRKLEKYRDEGIIGKFIHDDLQDEGDNATGVGGKSRREAFANAFGLMFPIFSSRFNGPSFLNIHPVKGHLHRRRSQTLQKAVDYIEVLLIKHSIAGENYLERAKEVLLNTEVQ